MIHTKEQKNGINAQNNTRICSIYGCIYGHLSTFQFWTI